MLFGQLVIGPPGSGKTTYCDGMQQYMSAMGRKAGHHHQSFNKRGRHAFCMRGRRVQTNTEIPNVLAL
eukprot:scaffold262408_cov25-Prasinocladus_malaysianus.AAC.1